MLFPNIQNSCIYFNFWSGRDGKNKSEFLDLNKNPSFAWFSLAEPLKVLSCLHSSRSIRYFIYTGISVRIYNSSSNDFTDEVSAKRIDY